MSETKKSEGIGRLILVLGLITFVCALLLGVVNQVTAPLIEQNENQYPKCCHGGNHSGRRI